MQSSTSMSRWVLRRQRRFALISCMIIVVATVAVITLRGDVLVQEFHLNPFSEECRHGAANELIQAVCSNVTRGLVFGGLCGPLCLQKSIAIQECVHHGTTFVLFGTAGHEEIVIKRKTRSNLGMMPEYFHERLRSGGTPADIRKYYFELLASEVKSQFGSSSNRLFREQLDRIVHDIFGSKISDISLEHLASSYDLVGQNELIMMALFQNLKHIPKLKGTCGPLYAVERSTPYGLRFPEVIPRMSWHDRVILAREFLSLVLAFQNSDAGPLHHCDMQEDNFGVTRNLEVKAIDIDLVYPDDRMAEILDQPSCSGDADCDFFDCLSKCNVTSGKCTSVRITNNLQILCRDIFQARWAGMGLLGRLQPRHVERELSRLLAECSSQRFGSLPMQDAAVQDMFLKLNTLLSASLQLEKER